jgi:hypothetical protein
MEKKRTLIVKHPRLKFIRDTLRQVIVSATYKEICRLLDEQMGYDVSKDEDKLIPLVRERQALQRALDASTCICPACGSKTSDMIFNTVDKSWYCISCYEERHEFYETHEHPEGRDNPFP